MIRRLPLLAAAAAALLMAACATTAPAPPPVAAVPPPAPVAVAPVPVAPPEPVAVVAPRDRIRAAVELLDRGQQVEARAELALLLAEHPDNTVGKSLMDQIDKDPKVLLGAKSYAYKVRAGETLSMLAERFLGDPLLFYALARYNGIERPDTNEVGRTLRIPGTPKRAVAATPAAPAAAAAKAPANLDPERANGLRRTALEAMNSGGIDRAVALLQQAAPLDPGNRLIRADLQRALRIQASVRNR
jgi:hypothetical protein